MRGRSPLDSLQAVFEPEPPTHTGACRLGRVRYPDDQVRPAPRHSPWRATAPALAAEYCVVRGPDKKCKVVETRPTDKTVVIVGDKAYVTREEATKQLAVVCKPLQRAVTGNRSSPPGNPHPTTFY